MIPPTCRCVSPPFVLAIKTFQSALTDHLKILMDAEVVIYARKLIFAGIVNKRVVAAGESRSRSSTMTFILPASDVARDWETWTGRGFK